MAEAARLPDAMVDAQQSPEAANVLDTSGAGGMVVRGGTLRVLGYLVAILVSVVGASLMLRHLGVVNFGHYTAVLSLITIVGSLSDLGLTGIGLRQAAVGDRAERERAVRNVLGIRLTTSVIGVLLACLFGILVGYPSVMIEGTALAGAGLLALVTFDSYTMQLQVDLKLGWTAALELLRQLGQTFVVIALVLAGASLLPFMGAQIPGAVAAAALAAVVARRSTRLLPSFDRAQWMRLARDLLPYAAASAIGAVYFRVEIVVLSLVSSGKQTGLFSAAFRITEVVVGIPWLVAASALPLIAHAAEHDRARLSNALQRMFEVSLTAGVGLALAIFLGAQFAIEVVAGPHYLGSVDVLHIQSVTVAFTFLVTEWGFALLALKRTRALLAINGAGFATAIGVTLLLGSVDGAKGASVALVGAEAVLAGGYALFLARVSPSLRPRLRSVPRVALATAAGLGVAAISSTSSLPATVIGVSVYALVLAASGGLPPELWELLPGRHTPGVSGERLRSALGGSRGVRRITDSKPVGRVIATATHARLVRNSLAYVARELSGRGGSALYRLRYGGLLVYLRHNTTDGSILEEIFAERIYEPPPVVEARLSALGRAPRIADLGANVGLFDAFALTRWQGTEILAFEPHPQNVALLRRTIAANDLGERWRLIEACAYIADGELPFALDHFSDSHALEASSQGERGESANELVAAVDVFPLIADFDLVKIDIEGGEWALLCDPRMAALSAVAIAIEYHPHLAPGTDARAQAMRLLEAAGYEVQEVFHDPCGHGMLWAWRPA